MKIRIVGLPLFSSLLFLLLSMEEDVQACIGQWTPWYDRDTPGGFGEYETLSALRRMEVDRRGQLVMVCSTPSLIEGRVVTTRTVWHQSGDVLTVSPTTGLSCVNRRQRHRRRCKNYEVRFCCPHIEYRMDVRQTTMKFINTLMSIASGGGTDSRPESSNCKDTVHVGGGNITRMLGRSCATGRRKKRAAASTKPRDILFLVDESGSIGATNFKLFPRLIRAIVNLFCTNSPISVRRDQTRIGIVSFSDRQYLHMDLDDQLTRGTVMDEIDRFRNKRYNGGGTCLIDSLEYSRTNILSTSFGGRLGADKLVVLLSDGCGNCNEAGRMSSLLNNMNMKYSNNRISLVTYLVGSPNGRCIEQFQALTGTGGHCYETFIMQDWVEAEASIGDLESMNCQDSWPPSDQSCLVE